MDKNEFTLEQYRLNESRVIRDAIHGYITFEYLPIWQLIATAEVQRLRRIKQLGGTYMVFPSAEHSRFTHSLGVYETVRKMCALDEIDKHLNDYEKLTVMCAGLLHDIGHGPFSHTFEGAFHTNHEEMTRRMILEDSEVHQVLKSVHEDLPLDVANVIAHKASKPMIVQMVSSQLDADRMDYLLRDSYFAGVTYGEFDRSRILRTLRIKDDRIVFKYSGVQAIEDYILARYHMYYQVYFHPTARSYEHVFQLIAKRLTVLYEQGYHFQTNIQYLLPFISGEKMSVAEYEALDENVIYYYIGEMQNEDDAILSDLCQRFINRHLFKYESINDASEIEEYRKKTIEKGLDPDYYVVDDEAIQVPYKHYGVGKHTGEIEILMEDGTISTLSDTSHIVNAILHSKPKIDRKVFFVRNSNWRKETDE